MLIRALESKLRHISARGNLGLADRDVVVPVGDDLPQVLIRVDSAPALVNVGDVNRVTDLQLTAVQRFQPHDGLEQSGLTHTVRTDNPNDAVPRQGEGEVSDENATVEFFVQVLGVDYLRAEARPDRNYEFLEVELSGLLRLGRHFLVAGKTCLRLGLATLLVAAHPVEFLSEPLRKLLVFLPLHLQSGLLLLEVGRVVALIGVEVAAIDLGDPFGHVIEEVPIVGDGEDCAGVFRQELFQPQHTLGVEVVRGFV